MTAVPAWMRDLDDAQRALAQRMSTISEAAFCAGWMGNLEHALWQVLEQDLPHYGRCRLGAAERDELRGLARACGGWIVWERQRGATFVPLVQWRRRFDAGLAF